MQDRNMKRCPFVYMAEKDNTTHTKLLHTSQVLLRSAPPKDAEAPPSVLKQVITPSVEIKPTDFIEEPTTGKRIYPKDAVLSVSRYIDYLQSLSCEGGSRKSIWHQLRQSGDSHTCVLQLPRGHEPNLSAHSANSASSPSW